MKTKIKNFLHSVSSDTKEVQVFDDPDKAQTFIYSIDDKNIQTLVLYILCERNIVNFITLEQLIFVVKFAEKGSVARQNAWKEIQEIAWNFSIKAFVWFKLSSGNEQTEEELELFEDLKLSLLTEDNMFYKVSWMYKETQEKFWWKKARDRASNSAELTWMLETMHSFHNSWYDDGAEWTEKEFLEAKNSIEYDIRRQVELGAKEISDTDYTCKLIEEKIAKVVFVPIAQKKSIETDIAIGLGQKEEQFKNKPDQATKKNVIKTDFDKAVDVWSKISADRLKEAKAFSKIRELANTFSEKVFVWTNEEPGSSEEKEAMLKLKYCEKTLKQKLYILGMLETDDVEALWLDVEKSIISYKDAILVWEKTSQRAEKRKKAWLFVKSKFSGFSQILELLDNPPIKLTVKEYKDLWSLLVANANELEELAFVWVRSEGELRREVYASIMSYIELSN